MGGLSGAADVRVAVRARAERRVDLSIVLDRDPIADLCAGENPVVVVNDGRIVVNRIGR